VCLQETHGSVTVWNDFIKTHGENASVHYSTIEGEREGGVAVISSKHLADEAVTPPSKTVIVPGRVVTSRGLNARDTQTAVRRIKEFNAEVFADKKGESLHILSGDWNNFAFWWRSPQDLP